MGLKYARLILVIIEKARFFVCDILRKNTAEFKVSGKACNPGKAYIKASIQNKYTDDNSKAERKNNHQQRCDYRNHHQGEKRDGESPDQRFFANISIDFKALHQTTILIRYVKIPTTAPAMSTKTKTRVMPFFRSAFSPKKWPALNRNPTRKITPRSMGKITRMVSEIWATEFSIPPICAKSGNENRNKKSEG